ncbi:MAG: 2-amino-4-hydroxy-6-hydroxymethyldihydropteridine diphosphokinase, partial [Burkholderiales bacterium]
VRAVLALGANLGDAPATVEAAIGALDRLPSTRLITRSSLYRTAPVGYAEQPDFINAVAIVETALAPRALLDALLALERTQGRTRSFANAPRTLDLDILLYGSQTVQESGLTIPHPRMHERAFVLVPLAEIAPDTDIPGHGRVADLTERLDGKGVVRIARRQHPEAAA